MSPYGRGEFRENERAFFPQGQSKLNLVPRAFPLKNGWGKRLRYIASSRKVANFAAASKPRSKWSNKAEVQLFYKPVGRDSKKKKVIVSVG